MKQKIRKTSTPLTCGVFQIICAFSVSAYPPPFSTFTGTHLPIASGCRDSKFFFCTINYARPDEPRLKMISDKTKKKIDAHLFFFFLVIFERKK